MDIASGPDRIREVMRRGGRRIVLEVERNVDGVEMAVTSMVLVEAEHLRGCAQAAALLLPELAEVDDLGGAAVRLGRLIGLGLGDGW